MEIELRAWDCTKPWEDLDAILLRSCWDYHLRPEEFRLWLARLDALPVRLWNPPRLVRWNMDKRYLLDLSTRGIQIVPTNFFDCSSFPRLASRLAVPQAGSYVIKPAIGATADGCRRVTHRDLELGLPGAKISGTWLLQPFLEEVSRDGEWSLVWLGGRFSHAVLKRPRRGDYRVQKAWGGTTERLQPDERLVRFANRVLEVLDQKPLYARIDIVLRDKECLLMELELIEPQLFLVKGDPGLDALARGLAEAR
jgi:glutathione synthase/RimK-type ligase-like ATP-grasp enzyme